MTNLQIYESTLIETMTLLNLIYPISAAPTRAIGSRVWLLDRHLLCKKKETIVSAVEATLLAVRSHSTR